MSELTAMTDNLAWTRSGTVWAMWRLSPQPYGYRTEDAKLEVRALHTGLLQALHGEALLLGVCASTDPAAVVEQMVTGVDLDARPQWADECLATLDYLEQVDIGARAYWLAMPLANPGSKAWTEPARSATARLTDVLAMPRTGPSRRQIAARLEQAELIRKSFPAPFQARPASVAEVVWLHLHAAQRGLDLDLTVPEHATDASSAMLTSPTAIPAVHLDPCGQTDSAKKALTPTDILTRRYLKVTGLDSGEPSYQVMLTLGDVPAGGITFPGGEWLGRLDESGIPADFALRMTIRSRDEVTARNRRANANLNDQLDQRSDEGRAGGPGQLLESADLLAEYQAALDADEDEVEVEHTAILAVGAPEPELAVDMARELVKYYRRSAFRLVTDAAAQEALWHAMLPGSPTTRAVRELSQITTASNLAAAVPVVSAELGDDRGSLLALETSGGRVHPVLLDLAGAGARLDVAMAVGVTGELGSGKSVTLKTLAMDAIDRGATLIAIDRTKVGEWANAIAPVPGSVVADVSDQATWSIDPLRIFGAKGGRMAQSFLTTLLNLSATDTQGVLLSDVLDPDYLKAHHITSLGALIDHLTGGDCAMPGADELGRVMRVYARKDFGRAVFDPSLPPLDLDAPAIVVRTAELELPDSDELNSEVRFKQMRLEKGLGRAVYALVAAIARHRCFADTTRLGVFVVDEAHSVTSSPEGLSELKEFVRDGRKHLAALILGSHDPEADFGDEVLRGLIALRIVMRHRDRTLAARSLRWLLGMPTTADVDEDLVDLIATETSPVATGGGVAPERRGECLLRDFQGRIGRATILPPAVPERAKAVLTTPGQVAA